MNSRRSTGLDFTGAYSRFAADPDHCLPQGAGRRKSASVTRLEQELKDAKEENARLRSEVKDVRSLLDEMVSPGEPEKFDERRVNLLKAQILQMQRQCNLLNNAIGSRYTILMEVENAMASMADNLRGYIAAEVAGAMVPVPRAELMKMVQSLESARIRLFRNLEDNSRDKLQRPLLFSTEFIAPGCTGLTLLDVASGRTDHVHLKQVSKLESRLAVLYKEVVGLSEALYAQDSERQPLLSRHTASALRERVQTQVLKAAAMLKSCSEDLLSLSILVPSAPPSSRARRTIVKGVTVQQAVAKLPLLPRYKAEEVQALIKAVVRCMNHRQQLLEKEVQALRKEVRFHQAVYQLQLSYVFSLIQAVREGYMNFQDNTNEVLVKPLKELLECYQAVKSRGDEASLRKFFVAFKEREDQLSEVVKKLGVDCAFSSGLESLSGFGAEFEACLEELVAEQQERRDGAAQEREELKEEQERLDGELRALIGDAEAERKRLQDLRQFAVENFQQGDNHDDQSVLNTQRSSLLEGWHVEGRVSAGKVAGQDRDAYLRTPVAVSSSRDGEVEALGLREWKNPPLHQHEWRGPLDLSDEDTSPRRSGFSVEVDTARSVGMSSRTPALEGEGADCSPPVSGKDKKKKSRSTSRPPRPTTYQPNLAVANRTLKLRRAENLSRQAGLESPGPGQEDQLGEDTRLRTSGGLVCSPLEPSGLPAGDRSLFTPMSGRRSRSSSLSGRRSGRGPDRPPSADRK